MCFAAYSNGTFRISLEPKVLTKMLNIKKCFQSSYTFLISWFKTVSIWINEKKIKEVSRSF